MGVEKSISGTGRYAAFPILNAIKRPKIFIFKNEKSAPFGAFPPFYNWWETFNSDNLKYIFIGTFIITLFVKKFQFYFGNLLQN